MELLTDYSAGGGMLAVGSETDDLLALMESFGHKKVTSDWATDPEAPPILTALTVGKMQVPYGFGFACHKGKKPESPNQDSWCMLHVEGRFSLYGVFDGHGGSGHHISNFVKENLPKLIVRSSRIKVGGSWSEVLKEAFLDMQGMITAASEPNLGWEPLSANMAGTTATVVVHDYRTKSLVVANVGDSSACLGCMPEDKPDEDARKSPESEFALKAKPLTVDHKPVLTAERARIEKNGGMVIWDGYSNHRVFIKGAPYPGLNMSRCLGDLIGHSKAGLSAEPDIKEHGIQETDKLIVLGSDGLWDFMPADEVMDFVWSYGSGRSTEAAEALAKEAWDRWISSECGNAVDDITVLVIFLSHEVHV